MMTTTTMTTSKGCLIEENIKYDGNDINNAWSQQANEKSCRSFCETNYPTAKYFTLNKWNTWCLCKTSDAGREAITGYHSGEICPIEENISYTGSAINDANDPEQNDAVSCRSFCETNYSNAQYFTWNSHSKKCRCKAWTSDIGTKVLTGVYSGKI